MKLSPGALGALFVIGAAGGLVGDHAHVVTETTRYAPTDLPFIWDSAIWFPLLVGSATAALGELRLHLAPPRRGGVAHGVAGSAAVLGIYALTGMISAEPPGPATTLIAALAAITWATLGDGVPAAVCGAVAAVVGTTVEIVMSAADVFAYAEGVDDLLGVAPWLPALYFAFGVVAARLGELAATRWGDLREDGIVGEGGTSR